MARTQKKASSLVWDMTLALFASTILGLGIYQIILEKAVLDAFYTNTNDHQTMMWPENTTQHDLAAKPQNLLTVPTSALIAEGALSIVLASAFLVSIMMHFVMLCCRSSRTVRLISYKYFVQYG